MMRTGVPTATLPNNSSIFSGYMRRHPWLMRMPTLNG